MGMPKSKLNGNQPRRSLLEVWTRGDHRFLRCGTVGRSSLAVLSKAGLRMLVHLVSCIQPPGTRV